MYPGKTNTNDHAKNVTYRRQKRRGRATPSQAPSLKQPTVLLHLNLIFL